MGDPTTIDQQVLDGTPAIEPETTFLGEITKVSQSAKRDRDGYLIGKKVVITVEVEFSETLFGRLGTLSGQTLHVRLQRYRWSHAKVDRATGTRQATFLDERGTVYADERTNDDEEIPFSDPPSDDDQDDDEE